MEAIRIFTLTCRGTNVHTPPKCLEKAGRLHADRHVFPLRERVSIVQKCQLASWASPIQRVVWLVLVGLILPGCSAKDGPAASSSDDASERRGAADEPRSVRAETLRTESLPAVTSSRAEQIAATGAVVNQPSQPVVPRPIISEKNATDVAIHLPKSLSPDGPSMAAQAIPEVSLPDSVREAARSSAAAANLERKLTFDPPTRRVEAPRAAGESAFEKRSVHSSQNLDSQAKPMKAAPSDEPKDGDERLAAMVSPQVMQVFYVTDREPVDGIGTGDWLKVHTAPLVAGVVLLAAGCMTVMLRRRVLYGVVALVSLVSCVGLGHDAMIEWQKRHRLALNGDLHYTAELKQTRNAEPLDYGTCHVNIPPNHQIGHIDRPSIIKLEFREDTDKHIVLQRVIRSEKSEFYRELRGCMSRSTDNQAFVFIHGYNVSFESAVMRTAQIAYDLEFDGAPICYSWPSHGALENYVGDMANADSTVYQLQAFLTEVVERTGSSTIHLIAHSMGNRALMQALDRIAVGQKSPRPLFGQLVMAAPDVSDSDFRSRYASSAKQLTQAITLYASSRDRALQASTRFHGQNRAGLAGENLVLVDGVDTIDVSEIDTSLIGHSYYGDHPELIRDLRALVELAQPAGKRSWLDRFVSPAGFRYWKFIDMAAQAPRAPSAERLPR